MRATERREGHNYKYLGGGWPRNGVLYSVPLKIRLAGEPHSNRSQKAFMVEAVATANEDGRDS